MGKVLVTENELKKIIAESVKEMINERNYFGADWDQLTPQEKQKFANRYNNWNLKGKWGTNAAGINSPEVQQRYQTIQARKQRHGNASFSQDQGQRLAKDSADLKTVYNKLGANAVEGAIQKIDYYNSQIQTLQQEKEQLNAQVTDLTEKLRKANASIAKQQNDIKNLNAQLAQKAQATPQQPVQQQQPLNPQTDGAKAAAYGNNTQLASR